MKIYFLADCHIGSKGGNEDVLNDYKDYFEKVFIPYCKEHVKPNDKSILCILGDWFDNRAQLDLLSISYSIKLFEQFSEIFEDIRIIVGNHDMFKKYSNDITSVDIFKHIPNVKIYYEPTVEELSDKKVLFLPWVEDLKLQRELIKKYDVDYVFGHLAIGGCVTNNKGMTLKSYSAQSDDFKKAQVYAGHIHMRQDYKNIHYVGTPYHVNRGDIGNKKGITILKIESGRTDFVENKFSPQYKQINLYDILDSTIDDLKTEWNNNYIDLVVKCCDSPDCNFEPLKECLKTYYKEFKTIDVGTNISLKDDNIDLSETKPFRETLNDYINQSIEDEDIKESVKETLEKITDKYEISCS